MGQDRSARSGRPRRLPEWFRPDRWVPPPGSVDGRNVTRFMRAHGLAEYRDLLDRAAGDPDWFYPAAFAHLDLGWIRPFHRVFNDANGIEWVRWFGGGKTNLAHLAAARWRALDGAAVVWEGDDGATRVLGYRELDDLVAAAAGGFRALGLAAGDVAALYLPMVPEAVVALLALARIGAVAVPVFSGFAAPALAERIRLSGATILVTADGFLRRGRRVPMKTVADEALASCPEIRKVVVVPRTRERPGLQPERDVWWDALLEGGPAGAMEGFDAHHPFLVGYTSGSTGRPKGVVHTHGGMPYRLGIELGFNFDMRRGDRLCWVTDMGWIMGPVSVVGPLTLGATTVLFEGVPDWPAPDRLWDLVERHGVTHLGLSPTLARMLAAAGPRWVEERALPSLRALGITGEPCPPSAWRWLHAHVGRGQVPIINWTGGAEIGAGILIGSPVVEMRESRFAGPAPGMSVDVYDDGGRPVVGAVGELVITRSFPSMTRGLWREPERFIESYWSRWPGVWVHGDRAVRHEDGSWELPGRSDDIIKVGGKRIGPAEYEAAAGEVAGVAAVAAVGLPDALKGEAAVLVVVPADSADRAGLPGRVRDHVAGVLGRALMPREVLLSDALPLTRSGKLHRRVLRGWLVEADPGDLSSLANPESAGAVSRARQQLGGSAGGGLP